MSGQVWGWALSLIGVVGFVLAGRKIWWAWYVNIANQAVWTAYALITRQYGFLVGVVVYTVVFVGNARRWTAEHRDADAQAELERTEATTTPSPTGGTFRRRATMVEGMQWDGSYDRARQILDWVRSTNGAGGYKPASAPSQRDVITPSTGTAAAFWIYSNGISCDIPVSGWVVFDPFTSARHIVYGQDEMIDCFDLTEESA